MRLIMPAVVVAQAKREIPTEMDTVEMAQAHL
jgi:hypothetical protein